MAFDMFSDLASVVLARSLDAAAARHKVIANNIANAETPGFTRSDVAFESKLKQALNTGEGGDIISRVREVDPEIQPDAVTPAGPNGNNVMIDKEMADMNKNTLRYQAYVELRNLKGRMLREVIKEGRG